MNNRFRDDEKSSFCLGLLASPASFSVSSTSILNIPKSGFVVLGLNDGLVAICDIVL